MSSTLVFRCECCGATPDRDTDRVLRAQLRDRRFARFLIAQPGAWLIFTGGGPLGGKRYACGDHGESLVADLRHHYGTLCAMVRDPGPYPELWPNGFSSLDERELAELLAPQTHR